MDWETLRASRSSVSSDSSDAAKVEPDASLLRPTVENIGMVEWSLRAGRCQISPGHISLNVQNALPVALKPSGTVIGRTPAVQKRSILVFSVPLSPRCCPVWHTRDGMGGTNTRWAGCAPTRGGTPGYDSKSELNSQTHLWSWAQMEEAWKLHIGTALTQMSIASMIVNFFN